MMLSLTRHAPVSERSKRRVPTTRFSAVATQSRPEAVPVRANWTTLPGGVVEGGEIVVLAIKPSMWLWLFDSVPWLVMCTALGVILTALNRPFLGLSPTGTLQILALVAFARVSFAMLRWIPTWYVLTNRRLIDVRGVRAARIRSCPLINVSDVLLEESTLEKAAKLGSIYFELDSSEAHAYVWQSIQAPKDVFATVRTTINNARNFGGRRG